MADQEPEASEEFESTLKPGDVRVAHAPGQENFAKTSDLFIRLNEWAHEAHILTSSYRNKFGNQIMGDKGVFINGDTVSLAGRENAPSVVDHALAMKLSEDIRAAFKDGVVTLAESRTLAKDMREVVKELAPAKKAKAR